MEIVYVFISHPSLISHPSFSKAEVVNQYVSSNLVSVCFTGIKTDRYAFFYMDAGSYGEPVPV